MPFYGFGTSLLQNKDAIEFFIWEPNQYESKTGPHFLSYILTHTEKNRGAAHLAASGLHVGNGVGCPWAAHGNFAMQIRLPTTSIYGNSGQLSRLPILPYMETVGSSVFSSVGCPLLPYMETVGSSVGSGVGCPWAAHGNFAMQIRLPTTSIYGNSGQLSGKPTNSKCEKVGSSVGSGVGCPWEFCHAN